MERRTSLRPVPSTAKRRPISAASPEQRAKVKDSSCLVCTGYPVDPAHVVPRSLGGCDDALCVVPLCRRHHREYDLGALDLLPYLEPRLREEQEHAVGHLGLARAYARLTNDRAVAA